MLLDQSAQLRHVGLTCVEDGVGPGVEGVGGFVALAVR